MNRVDEFLNKNGFGEVGYLMGMLANYGYGDIEVQASGIPLRV